MTTLASIAAVLAEAEDMFNVVFLLIFIVIGIIASIAKKAMEKKKQEQRERERAEQAAQAPRQPQPPVPRRPQPVRPQPRRSPIVTAEVAEPLDTLGAGVAGEVQHLQQRRATADRQRAARLATQTPLEADTAAIERRPVSVGRRRGRRSAGKVTSVSRAALKVDLHSRAAARHAIVHFEIFSPPKALRTGGEMWDL